MARRPSSAFFAQDCTAVGARGVFGLSVVGWPKRPVWPAGRGGAATAATPCEATGWGGDKGEGEDGIREGGGGPSRGGEGI